MGLGGGEGKRRGGNGQGKGRDGKEGKSRRVEKGKRSAVMNERGDRKLKGI